MTVLAGRRLVVARARPGPSAVAAELRARGASVREAPRLEVAWCDEALRARAGDLGGRAVALACEHSVVAAERAGVALARLDLIAIGPAATRALRARGIEPRVSTPGACADALAVVAGAVDRLVLLASERGRPRAVADLAALGVDVQVIAAYRVEHAEPAPMWPAPLVDAVLLPSSSAARALYRAWPALTARRAIAIGPRSAAAGRALGVRVLSQSVDDSPESLIAAAVAAMVHPVTETSASTRREARR